MMLRAMLWNDGRVAAGAGQAIFRAGRELPR